MQERLRMPERPSKRGRRGGRFALATALGLASLAPTPALAQDVYVADPNADGGGGAVFRVDLATGAQAVVSSGGQFVDPTGLSLDPQNRLVVADPGAAGGSGAIFRIDPATGEQTLISSDGLFVNPTGVDADVGSFYEVADPDAAPSPAPAGFGDGNVFTVIADSGVQNDLDLDTVEIPFVDPTDVASPFIADPNAGPDGAGALFAKRTVCGGKGCLPAFDVVEVRSSGGSFSDPVGVALAPRHLPGPLVADASAFGGQGAVFSVPPDGGQVVVSSGGELAEPRDLIHYPATVGAAARLLVADRDAAGGSGALLAVDPATGTQSVVSSSGAFVDPSGIATQLPFCFGGDEQLTALGTPGPDSIAETDGIDDVIAALEGNDVVTPDPDEDEEDVDFVCGGDGDDTVGGGEGRENVVAGAGNDQVDLGDGDDDVEGEAGDDTARGGGGRDLLVGGFDLVSGTPDPGADLLRGDKGKDFLYGQDGNDKLKGGKGKDRLTGGPGNDKLRARDGERDLVKCGGGKDSAWVDRKDTVRRSCEKVRGAG